MAQEISNTNSNVSEVFENKVKKLLSLSDEFIFPEFYSHTNETMWKVKNIYTQWNKEIIVLCSVYDGIEKAIDLAIKHISDAKNKFFN
jgi:hypothetical protein